MFTIFSYNVHYCYRYFQVTVILNVLVCKPPNVYDVLTYSDIINSIYTVYHKIVYYIDYMLSIKKLVS